MGTPTINDVMGAVDAQSKSSKGEMSAWLPGKGIVNEAALKASIEAKKAAIDNNKIVRKDVAPDKTKGAKR